MTTVTTDRCNQRHKTLGTFLGWLVVICIAAFGGVGTISLLSYSMASEAAAKQDARESRIDELHKDVREIRSIVVRIEKNNGKGG